MNNYNQIVEILQTLSKRQKMMYAASVAQMLSPFVVELADNKTKELFNEALNNSWEILLGSKFENDVLLLQLKSQANLYIFEEIDQDEFVGDDIEWDVSNIVGIMVHFFELYFDAPNSLETSAISSFSLGFFAEIDYYLRLDEKDIQHNFEDNMFQHQVKILDYITSAMNNIELLNKIKKLITTYNNELSKRMPLIMEKTERWMNFEE